MKKNNARQSDAINYNRLIAEGDDPKGVEHGVIKS